MIWFILAVILLLIGVGMIAVALANGGDGAGFGFIPIIVAALLMIPACLYSLDVGEVAVIRNMGGSVAGHAENASFHAKAPWQSVIKYDTRNNLINFFKDTDYKYDGGSAEGKEITVNDRSGASANIDIQVNYSLEPSAAEMLYSEYGKQTTFTQNYIGNDLRSVARETSGKFDTITMLTDRGKYTKAVQDALTSKWKSIGLTVDRCPCKTSATRSPLPTATRKPKPPRSPSRRRRTSRRPRRSRPRRSASRRRARPTRTRC